MPRLRALRVGPVCRVDYVALMVIIYGSCLMPVLPGMRRLCCARSMPGCVR